MTGQNIDRLLELLLNHTFAVWDAEHTTYGLTDSEVKELDELIKEKTLEELNSNYEKSKADLEAGRFEVMTAQEFIEFMKSNSKNEGNTK